MVETLAQEAFKLKGRLFTITVLQLLQNNLTQIKLQLNLLVTKAPRLFQHAPIIIDLNELPITQQQLLDICAAMRDYHMIPVGVQSAASEQLAMVQACGLAHFTPPKDKQDPELNLATGTPPPKQSAPKATAAASKIITTPVRSGQQIYAEGGDLIVLASVGYGSELLADGHIHIYGTLRGRALAGIKGNQQARIFCKQLDADLISIAGNYIVHDAIKQFKHQGACQIYLEDNKLLVDAL